MSCLGGLCVCLCPLVRLLHCSIKFPSYCTRLDAGLIAQSLVSDTLLPPGRRFYVDDSTSLGWFHVRVLVSRQGLSREGRTGRYSNKVRAGVDKASGYSKRSMLHIYCAAFSVLSQVIHQSS